MGVADGRDADFGWIYIHVDQGGQTCPGSLGSSEIVGGGSLVQSSKQRLFSSRAVGKGVVQVERYIEIDAKMPVIVVEALEAGGTQFALVMTVKATGLLHEFRITNPVHAPKLVGSTLHDELDVLSALSLRNQVVDVLFVGEVIHRVTRETDERTAVLLEYQRLSSNVDSRDDMATIPRLRDDSIEMKPAALPCTAPALAFRNRVELQAGSFGKGDRAVADCDAGIEGDELAERPLPGELHEILEAGNRNTMVYV